MKICDKNMQTSVNNVITSSVLEARAHVNHLLPTRPITSNEMHQILKLQNEMIDLQMQVSALSKKMDILLGKLR